MSRLPSVKSLLLLVLFTGIATGLTGHSSWAYLQLDQAEEYRIKADKFQSEGRLDQAIIYYHKAIALDKYCLAAYNSLAICYEKKGFFSKAEEWYLKALQLNPQYPPVYYNLGLFYENYGDIEKAVFFWKKRMHLGHRASPGRIRAQLKLKKYAPEVLKAEQAKELERAIERQKEKDTLDKILGHNRYKTKEEEIQDHFLEGMQSYQEGDYQKTAESFHKMIEALPISN